MALEICSYYPMWCSAERLMMNTRIQELVDQAQRVVCYTDGGYTPIMALDPEKFAQLIYKQCRDIVGKTRDIAIDRGWNIDEAMSTAMYDIDEYFGAEQ